MLGGSFLETPIKNWPRSNGYYLGGHGPRHGIVDGARPMMMLIYWIVSSANASRNLWKRHCITLITAAACQASAAP